MSIRHKSRFDTMTSYMTTHKWRVDHVPTSQNDKLLHEKKNKGPILCHLTRWVYHAKTYDPFHAFKHTRYIMLAPIFLYTNQHLVSDVVITTFTFLVRFLLPNLGWVSLRHHVNFLFFLSCYIDPLYCKCDFHFFFLTVLLLLTASGPNYLLLYSTTSWNTQLS